MTSVAGAENNTSPPRRRGGTAIMITAALLVLGGGTAVAVGVLSQDPAPPAPPAALADQNPAPTPAETVPEPEPSAPSVIPSANPVALPVEVRIPAIDVQSQLLTLGLNPDGTLQVPPVGPDYDRAAWYDGSSRPGELGPAVIEGHVDGAGTGPSIFYELGSLTVGDQVEVVRADGSVVIFVVDEVRGVAKDEFPTVEVYGHTKRPELRLITCGGELDSDGHYVGNTIVFAHQV